MTYEPGPGDDEAKVMDENAWNRANLVSRKTLEGLNPGRECLPLSSYFRLPRAHRSLV